MHESILNFSHGKETIATPVGIAFAGEILDYMREILVEFQEATGNLYNLEATPGEGTTYRFAKKDQQYFPDIIQAGTAQAPYYTNSSQLPVDYTDDLFEEMKLQDELQCKYTGGTVLHLYMTEKLSTQNCKMLVKKALENHQMPYISITPIFSICPRHGYLA
jgi:ribonucleoside-triphosphate reductase